MTLTAWLTIVGICFLGAMSPGPSLAVVLKHTLSGSRKQGYVAAITHGLGVGLYALICISGLAVVITTSEFLFALFQWAGAAYLIWLGIKGLRAQPTQQPLQMHNVSSAARDGFMIVFLNPKIAVFFIALFAQVVGTETTYLAKFVYAATAMFIDGFWYVLVAWLMGNQRWLGLLQRQAVWLDRLFGVVLIALASQLILDLV